MGLYRERANKLLNRTEIISDGKFTGKKGMEFHAVLIMFILLV